jgi:hypothetical protein
MSWDISIQKFTRTYATFDELDDDTQPLPLGPRADVLRAFPGTDWSDPAWGSFDAPFGSIEFNSGTDDPVDSIMLHVRASDAVVPAIVQMCRDNGWQALDISGGGFLEQSAVPESGLRAWREYRDQVIGPDGGSPAAPS